MYCDFSIVLRVWFIQVKFLCIIYIHITSNIIFIVETNKSNFFKDSEILKLGLISDLRKNIQKES